MGLTLKQTVNLNSYKSDAGKRLSGALDKVALEVQDNQQRTIVARVKDFTGNLFTSVQIKSPNATTRTIGPNLVMAPYAPFVEEGRPSVGFIGYHFVKTSLDGVQLKYKNLIRASLERS